MSRIVAEDRLDGKLTRIYVWYPDEPVHMVLPDWQHDPVIATQLAEINPGMTHPFSVARYYWNPEPTGQVLTITRLIQ